MSFDYNKARTILEENFAIAEANYLQGSFPSATKDISLACDVVFSSKSQAYREVLLGCLIAKIVDKDINIRQPYVNQGSRAFSGRTLDERVINPFLHNKQIPCSKGPYLAVFRRSVQLDEAARSGLRDKTGYDAFLKVLGYVENISEKSQLLNFPQYLHL